MRLVMSAPDTNVKNQKRRHRTPLVGMLLAVGFALALLALYAVVVAWRGETPQEPSAQVDDFTGQVEQKQDTAVEQSGSAPEAEH